MIPIHIVTGFLGAGKTTLINRLLRAPELAETLVVVNEWGEIGLDHLLYETVADDVVLLSSGCLCCGLRGDLVDGLSGVLNRRAAGELSFQRIVLETSGLADPAPILHALFADARLSRQVRLAAVTTLVDAINGSSTLERFGEARRQVALADRLLLAKTDLVGDTALLRAALSAINPSARVLDLARESFGAEEFLSNGDATPARGAAMSAHEGSIRSRSFTTDRMVEAAAFARFLELVGAALGPHLLRVKGLVGTRDDPNRPWLIQGAQHAFAPPTRLAAWPGRRRETILVVISDGLETETVERLWRALVGIVEIDRADWAATAENPLAPRRGGLL